jgi:hypothetical protein
MMLTKETMIHIAVVTAVTGAIFGVIFSSGITNITSSEISVIAKGQIKGDMLFLSYTIYNTGDYQIQNVTVTAQCCSHDITLYNIDDTPLLNILESKKYMDVISSAGYSPGDNITVSFVAYDVSGNNAVDIMTVPLM